MIKPSTPPAIQRLYLVCENSPELVGFQAAERFEEVAAWADIAEDVFCLSGGLSSELSAGCVNVPNAVCEAVPGKREAIAAKGIRKDCVSCRLQDSFYESA